MSSRIPSFDPEQLGEEARSVHDRILSGRGYLPGPYRFWLSSPGFAERIEPVEEFLRYGVSLQERQVEIVVLLVARHWRSAYVWTSHAPAALRSGVSEVAVDAILAGEPPPFESDADRICHDLVRALLEERSVDDALWERARSGIGEQQVNEIMGLLGLYTAVCLTMVAYRMPTKSGEDDPFA
jgi:4-carboxymuconolactone decarboxylase